MGNGQEVRNYKGSGGRGCEGIKRDAAAGTEEAERRRWRGKCWGKTRRGTRATGKRRAAWVQDAHWGAEGVVRATTFLPHLQVCCRPPGRGPQIALPQPHHPPRGSKRWRKTRKPTKIFQIRQICGADKSHAGWDEASVAPQWGAPVKSDLWLQKNASSPALGLGGPHCLSGPQKSPRWGCPQ